MTDNDQAREALKPCPCPWCQSTNVATQPDDQQGTKWGFAYCADCGIRGPEVRTSYKMADDAPWRFDAIVAWNDRRAPLQHEAIPEGWKLVPKNPTPDMLKAAKPWLSNWQHMNAATKDSNLEVAYECMLNTAPLPAQIRKEINP